MTVTVKAIDTQRWICRIHLLHIGSLLLLKATRSAYRRKVEPAESIRVREDVHLGNAPVGDCEADHGEEPAVGAPLEKADIAIDQDDLLGQAHFRERRRLSGDGLGASHDP